MNFYFKLFFFLVLISGQTMALQVESFYTSLCDRKIGITLFVDKRFAYFLDMNGDVIKLPRYQILSIASYPLDHLPIKTKVTIPSTVPTVKFWALNQGQEVLLGEGFVLGHNLDGIQLLNSVGQDVFISNDSIWRVEILNDHGSINPMSNQKGAYYFSHPQKGQCSEKKSDGVVVYPSELISNPVSVKRRLDTQILAFKKVSQFNEAQTFYAVPQLYKNFTSIGYWFPIGSRYGNSSGRVSGLAPLIRNEYSQGPFSFQHLSLTGAGPVPNSIHEEPQTMIYYAFKASYIHFAGFIDPSLILAGTNYQWQDEDLGGLDERVAESGSLALGFDRGQFSLTFFLTSNIFGAYKVDDIYNRYTASLFRLGLGWKSSKASLTFNIAPESEVKIKDNGTDSWDGNFNFFSLIGNYEFNPSWQIEGFLFSRSLDATSVASRTFSSNSKTYGFGIYHFLTRRWKIGSRISVEKNQYDVESESINSTFVKSGLFTSLNF